MLQVSKSIALLDLTADTALVASLDASMLPSRLIDSSTATRAMQSMQLLENKLVFFGSTDVIQGEGHWNAEAV